MSAPFGGVADSTVVFHAIAQFFIPCDVAVDTHAPWCTAWADSAGVYPRELHVTADAAGLPLGTYETEIELFSDHYGPPVARCLPVQFTVGETPKAAL